jgi:adenylate cyclase
MYVVRFLRSERQKKDLRDTFSRYVSPDVVERIIQHPEWVDLGGESREVSVFFSDLEGFTALSEQLESRAVMELLNDYLDRMSRIILEEKGTIDKFMGDAIMAFWGAPLDYADHALAACRAALRQQALLPEINAQLRAAGLPDLAVRMGINTGEVTVGNVGTAQRVEYTAIGDHVNLGSRLEGVNKQYGTSIIVSEFTYKAVCDVFFLRELDFIRVKGKQQPVRIYELMGTHDAVSKKQKMTRKIYEEALVLYRSQDWSAAKSHFTLIQENFAAQVMLERISALRKNPPGANWDGVYIFETK